MYEGVGAKHKRGARKHLGPSSQLYPTAPLILTPGFAPLCSQNKVNFGDISKGVTLTFFPPLM